MNARARSRIESLGTHLTHLASPPRLALTTAFVVVLMTIKQRSGEKAMDAHTERSGNLWDELEAARRSRRSCEVKITLATGVVIEGVVLVVVEGWIKLSIEPYARPVWVNMDMVMLWQLDPR